MIGRPCPWYAQAVYLALLTCVVLPAVLLFVVWDGLVAKRVGRSPT